MDNAPPTTKRITELYKWHKENRLELHPPFQRKPVWSRKNQSFLIDTILNGLPVPEVYIQVKTDTKGNTKYIVVDGQQRINSIVQFIEGEYILEEDESENFGGKGFTDLSDGHKTDFWDYSIVTRELKTSSEEEVRAIFTRLNKYVIRLNPQELRNATYTGHFIHLMNKLSEDPFWADNRIVSPSDIKRMLDAEYISEIFVGLIAGFQNKKLTLDNYYQLYDDKFDDKESKEREFLKILTLIQEIFGDLRPTIWRGKSDFYSLYLSLAELSKEYIIPTEKYAEIKIKLNQFEDKILTEGEASKDSDVREYSKIRTKGSSDLNSRKKRNEILRKLIIPYLIAKDPKRNFTNEERIIAWHLSKDKICAVCKKTVEYGDYELDHIKPHSKGGKTSIANSQITHEKCNASKGGKD